MLVPSASPAASPLASPTSSLERARSLPWSPLAFGLV